VTRNVFLVLGAILGVCVAAPIVLTYATVWWWLSVPAVLAYAVVLWRWGMAWVIDDDDFNHAAIPTRIAGLLIMLLWSFIGVALAVYLATLAAQNWPLIVVALLVVVGFVVAMWLSDVLKPKPNAAKAPPTPKPDDLVR
jgi:hypothetical protein